MQPAGRFWQIYGTLEEMSKHSFVIVSTRLPMSVSKENGKLRYSKASGGLATAMSSLKDDDMVWIGWCGIASDDLSSKDKQAIRDEFAKHGFVPVFLTKSQIALFYEGYSNDTLWPLFHYFQADSRYVDEYWRAYQEVNELFAVAVRSVAQAQARIWVHDYQLMLLPALIRELLPRSIIGFFLHIPFPSFEIYRLLPERTRLLEGVMGADVIGLHTYDYIKHFMSSCRRLLGVNPSESSIEYQDRVVRIGTYPIGIDYGKFTRTVATSEAKKLQRRLKRRYAKQRIILSVDRLDYSKGIPQRLEAYRLLLEQNPRYRGSVVLQMIAVPSRTEVERYKELRDKIEQTVSRINGMFGTADWVPISYQFQNRPFDEIVASYAAADVMLVTPVRDGMNLVAKEFVACKQHSPGVLVLSELAGAIDELTEAVSVNPNNPHDIASGIKTALEMPAKEQQYRLKTMQKRLAEYDVQIWAKSFLDDMKLAGAGGNRPVDMALTAERRVLLMKQFKAAKRKLIVLDYDGTLKPFTASPSMIVGLPSLRLRLLLSRLAQDDSVRLAVVSGRSRRSLQLWFRGMRMDIAAEHGAWTRYGGQWKHLPNTFKAIRPNVLRVMNRYAASTQGSLVEEKDYSSVWHYRNVVPELAFNRASKLRQELIEITDSEQVEVHAGDKIIEVKQKDINKGRVVDELVERYHPDFILCAGDDYTDEDMFRALGERGYSFKVGPGETHAKYRMAQMDELLVLLGKLAGKSTLVKRLSDPIILPWRR